MRRISGHGLQMALPPGCEARIYRRTPPEGARTFPILQAATFPIAPATGDYGSGAVETMGSRDVFVVLLEFSPESSATPLFQHQGLPRGLRPDRFHPQVLKRPIRGEAGTQWFFTEAGRPFTLYAVLGSYPDRARLVPRVNEMLRGITVAPA